LYSDGSSPVQVALLVEDPRQAGLEQIHVEDVHGRVAAARHGQTVQLLAARLRVKWTATSVTSFGLFAGTGRS